MPKERRKKKKRWRMLPPKAAFLAKCSTILYLLRREKDVFPFQYPPHITIAAKSLDTYLEYIKKPMDLHTVRTRLEEGAYKDEKAFVRDVDLIFSNAVSYNPPTSPVSKQAVVLRKMFYEMCEDQDIHTHMTKQQELKPRPASAPPTISYNPSSPSIYSSNDGLMPQLALKHLKANKNSDRIEKLDNIVHVFSAIHEALEKSDSKETKEAAQVIILGARKRLEECADVPMPDDRKRAIVGALEHMNAKKIANMRNIVQWCQGKMDFHGQASAHVPSALSRRCYRCYRDIVCISPSDFAAHCDSCIPGRAELDIKFNPFGVNVDYLHHHWCDMFDYGDFAWDLSSMENATLWILERYIAHLDNKKKL